MRDSETFGEAEGERGEAVGYSVIHFNDGEKNMELIGFMFYETEENSITWYWDSPVICQMVTIPFHRIKLIETRYEAIGESK